MVVDIPRLKNLKILFLIQGVGGGTVFQKKNYLSGDIRAQKAEKCTNNVVGKLFLPETYIFMDKIHNVMQRIPTCAIRVTFTQSNSTISNEKHRPCDIQARYMRKLLISARQQV